MHLIKKLPFAIGFFIFAVSVHAQTVKPKFKDITLVAYIPNDSTKNIAVTINIYYHVNADGMIRIIMNQMDPTNYHGKPTKYTGWVSDTTYRLADNVISDLNTIFNGKRELSSYRVRPKPTKGTSLMEPGTYMSYVALNGATGQMVFSDEAFGREMNMVLNRIIFARQGRDKSAGVYHDRPLEAKILKEHLACKCILVDVPPPTVQHL